MKTTITIILIGLLSTSCLTVDRISRNCDKFEKICITDVKKEVEIITNTVTEIEYRDTTIYKYLPGEVVEKKVPVYIKKGIAESDLSVLNTQLARSTARVFNSRLEHYLTQTDTTLPFKLENALKQVRILNTEKWKTEKQQTVTVTENTKFAVFAVKWFVGSLVLIILGIGYLFLKNKVKFLGKFG